MKEPHQSGAAHYAATFLMDAVRSPTGPLPAFQINSPFIDRNPMIGLPFHTFCPPQYKNIS